jgi:hypothetical protein
MKIPLAIIFVLSLLTGPALAQGFGFSFGASESRGKGGGTGNPPPPPPSIGNIVISATGTVRVSAVGNVVIGD